LNVTLSARKSSAPVATAWASVIRGPAGEAGEHDFAQGRGGRTRRDGGAGSGQKQAAAGDGGGA
jgi:hypothetical protein